MAPSHGTDTISWVFQEEGHTTYDLQHHSALNGCTQPQRSISRRFLIFGLGARLLISILMFNWQTREYISWAYCVSTAKSCYGHLWIYFFYNWCVCRFIVSICECSHLLLIDMKYFTVEQIVVPNLNSDDSWKWSRNDKVKKLIGWSFCYL